MAAKQILQETLIPPLASSNRCCSRWWYSLAGRLLPDLASKQRNTMTSTKFALGVLLLLISIAASSQPPDVQGKTFSGDFRSRHADVRPFTIRGPINPDSLGRLIHKARVTSDCLKNFKNVDLYVTFQGSNVSFAGSNADGNVTLLGTINDTGTLINISQYIINGSPSGGCEVDNGTGNLQQE